MTVKLLHATPIEILDKALTKCWGSECKTGDAMMERIDRIINKNKHGSIAEHCQVNIDVIGVSRALLQEVARHRMASLSVRSTRYTLKELRDEKPFTGNDGESYQEEYERANKYIVMTGEHLVDYASIGALEGLRFVLSKGISNDKAKYCLPESFRTSFTWTLNIRSLMNLLSLRTDKSALWEFRELAHEVFNVLPKEYQYLLQGYVKND